MRGQSGAREGAQCKVEASQIMRVKRRNTVFREQKRQQTLNRGYRAERLRASSKNYTKNEKSDNTLISSSSSLRVLNGEKAMMDKFILHSQHLTLADHIHLLLRDSGSHDTGVDRMAEGAGAVRKGLMPSQVVTAVGFQ